MNGHMAATRLIAIEDAGPLAELVRQNRAFMAAWDPIRPNDYFTARGQLRAIEEALGSHREGVRVPHVILDDVRIVGRVTLSNVVRGPFQSCNLGYWVSEADNGRGIATAAVARIMGVAFDDFGLHRIEAGTLLHNFASQRVLERNGFVRFGVAPRYLKIAGTWQDHVLYQALNPTSD